MATPARGPGRSRSLPAWLLVVSVAVGCAQPLLAETTPGPDDGPSNKTEIFNAMQEVRRKYGSDAVMLQGHLMSHAVRNGAVGETVAAVGAFEDRDGKRFLIFGLETGIVYNDREVNAADRPVRAWSDIAEASLRKFRTLTFPADGVVLRLSYAHRDSDSEAELRAHLLEQPGTPETAAFYLLLPDVGDMVAERITAPQLIGRSVVLVNGTPAHLSLPEPTAEPSGK